MTDNVETFISQTLHNLLFLEEFVFARNKFSPANATELELADAVVLLGDVLIICQIKERAKTDVVIEDAERVWFKNKVLGKATKQIRDTLKYLETFEEVLVANGRGHKFNLAAQQYRNVIKVVIYATGAPLPRDCAEVRHHTSKTAGFIHIVNAKDYLEVGRTLRVPEEVVRYFEYRQAVVESLDGSCPPEAAIAGHFIGGDPATPPSIDSAKYLHQLVNDEAEWDLAPFLKRLHATLTATEDSNDYYAILREFAKLPRSMWRAVKERLRLCIQKVTDGEFARPYRMAFPSMNCGFVFIPADPALVADPQWNKLRLNGLQNITAAHKYDQRLARCVGCLVSKDGPYFDIQWCFMEYDWAEHPEMEESLRKSSPFRPVSEALIHGYRFVAD